jgi:hypothetical protein
MVYFHAQTANFGICIMEGHGVEIFGIFHVLCFLCWTIRYFVVIFGTFFPVWVSCTKKNLATL